MPKWRCARCGQVFEGGKPPVPCPVCGAGLEEYTQVSPPVPSAAFQKDTDDHFVLVGGGVASVSAAKAIRKRNQTASLTILSGERCLPYNRPALNGVLERQTRVQDLALEQEDFYRRNNIQLRQGCPVASVNVTERQVTLESGERLPYSKLLLATGANPFNPIRQGHKTVPVHTLRSYEDATTIVEKARDKRVVVVGGGILGLEAACALRGLGCSVTVVEMAERLLPLQTDETASALLQDTLEALGIDFIVGDSVVSTTAGGVVMSGGVEMDADLVLASLGVRSEVSLAVALGLDLSRGILVDDQMRTSHPDIWAAGDCAEYDRRVQTRAGAALSMGSVAGAAMCGDDSERYTPFVPATAFRCGDFSLFSVGKIDARAARDLTLRDGDSSAYRRLFFEQDRLVGAMFVGANPGLEAVRAVQRGDGFNEALALMANRG